MEITKAPKLARLAAIAKSAEAAFPPKQTTQPNEALTAAAAEVVNIMDAVTLQAIINKAIKADSDYDKATAKRNSIFTECSASLRAGIATGLYSDVMAKEYDRRRADYVKRVVDTRYVDYSGEDKPEVLKRAYDAMMKGIQRDNAKALWVSPKLATERDEKRLARDAERKVIEREVEKKVKALVKKEPKADEKALRLAVKNELLAQSKEEREAKREEEAEAQHNRDFLTGVKAHKSNDIPLLIQDGYFGSKKDPRPVMQAYAAFCILFSDLIKD
jgi:hypothetical protein